jgi:arylsulfatase
MLVFMTDMEPASGGSIKAISPPKSGARPRTPGPASGAQLVRSDGVRLYLAGNKPFRVHLDGYNLMPFLKGEVSESPRKEFLYWSDDGDLMAIRVGIWKAAFLEQHGGVSPETPLGVWQAQFTKLRAPMLYNLRSDPFERSPDSLNYGGWLASRMFAFVPAQAAAGQWLVSFKEFPPRQKSASSNLDEVMRKMQEANKGAGQ